MTNENKSTFLPLNLQFFAEGGEPEQTPPTDENTSTNPEDGKDKTNTNENMIPYSRFKEVNDSFKSLNNSLKELGFDNVDSLKETISKFSELNQKEEERKRAERTELENIQSDLEKANQTIQELTQAKDGLLNQFKQEKITNVFANKVAEKGVPNDYLNAALKLANLSDLNLGEDGTVEGIDNVVDKLLTDNPFLTSVIQKEPETIGDSSNPKVSDEGQKTADEVLKEYAERAKKTGRHEDMVAYMRKKKELGR